MIPFEILNVTSGNLLRYRSIRCGKSDIQETTEPIGAPPNALLALLHFLDRFIKLADKLSAFCAAALLLGLASSFCHCGQIIMTLKLLLHLL